MAIAIAFSSCSDDKEELEPIVDEDKTAIFIDRLIMIYDDLIEIRDNAVFGDKKGEYPESSRILIEREINHLVEIIDGLKDGSRKLLASEMDGIISQATTAKSTFIASVRTEDYVPKPAELFVDGKGGRGYIDFGSHPEYSGFGDTGKQVFTVELWAKLKDVEGFYFLLSTFTDAPEDHKRNGWNINNHFGNLRMTYAINYSDLFEPGLGFNRTNEWVHIAMVTNEQGVDGEFDESGRPIMIKMYINGELVKQEGFSGGTYTKALETTCMLAFAGMESNGTMAPDKWASGSIKHFHIWKTAKSQAELQQIKDNPESVTGEEPDLVCGWPFATIPLDNENIKDLTGKYTAKIKGDFTWTELK